MKISVTLTLLVLLVSSADGSDQAWFKLAGFSSDGGYVAWETGGVQDGSGFPWILIEIVNTGNSLPEEHFYHVWDDCEMEPPDMGYVTRVRTDLYREFGIEMDYVGDLIVYHPATDLGVSPDTVSFCREHYFPGFNSGEITMTLESVSPEVDQEYPDWFPPPVSPVLSVSTQGTESEFFSESDVPDGYRNVFFHSIAAVYRNPAIAGSFLVVLHTEVPGFEGSDGRFRVVTGSIPE